MIGRRRDSNDGAATRADSMLDSKVQAAKDMRTSSTIRQAGNSRVQVSNKLDISAYRGNLYKQTLAPSWSKTKLREAQKKYNNIGEEVRKSIETVDATKREAYLNTTINGDSGWKSGFGRTSNNNSPLGGKTSPLFHKTVTNFAQVKYDDNGGLNPVSPVKRGLSLNNTIARASHPNEWRRECNSLVRTAKPSMDLDVSERAVSVFQPKKIVSDVDRSKKMFKKYSAFRNEYDPSTSKVEYKHFLDKVVQDVRHYDSNIGNNLAH